jgi:glycosyltransferase involved in cell wall biosynthesis
MKNVFWFSNINSIGGVETFFYYLARKYGEDHDITVYYSSGDPDQIARLRKYARVRRYLGGRIKCDKAFFNYNLDIIDSVEANEYIEIIHYDALAMKMMPNLHPKITRYIGVSQLVCDNFTKMTGLPCELCYNPIVLDKPKKYLRLVSATRLTAEKGKERMRILADMLDNEGIPFEWIVYTNDTQAIKNPNVYYRKPKLGIEDAIANADYLVQLSDGEGFCFSVVEALALGTPVIVTDCPVYKELGLQHGKNAFILPFDMTEVPIKAIAKGLPKVKFSPPKDRWNDILAEGIDTSEDEKTECIVIEKYYDLVFNRMMEKGDIFTVDIERANYLYGRGFVEI